MTFITEPVECRVFAQLMHDNGVRLDDSALKKAQKTFNGKKFYRGKSAWYSSKQVVDAYWDILNEQEDDTEALPFG